MPPLLQDALATTKYRRTTFLIKKNLLKFVFLSASDLPVIRKVLQHMCYPLVEQVKRKVSRLSFTVKNLTVGCLTFTLANQSVHGLGK